jgi:hypothetical protein
MSAMGTVRLLFTVPIRGVPMVPRECVIAIQLFPHFADSGVVTKRGGGAELGVRRGALEASQRKPGDDEDGGCAFERVSLVRLHRQRQPGAPGIRQSANAGLSTDM